MSKKEIQEGEKVYTIEQFLEGASFR